MMGMNIFLGRCGPIACALYRFDERVRGSLVTVMYHGLVSGKVDGCVVDPRNTFKGFLDTEYARSATHSFEIQLSFLSFWRLVVMLSVVHATILAS